MTSRKVVPCQLKYQEQQMKGRLGGIGLTLRKENVAVNNGRCQENHAIYLFVKVRQLNIEDFVHDYYSVERFKMAYQFQITPMNEKSEWPKVDLGFEMIPPPLQKAAGRPRK